MALFSKNRPRLEEEIVACMEANPDSPCIVLNDDNGIGKHEIKESKVNGVPIYQFNFNSVDDFREKLKRSIKMHDKCMKKQLKTNDKVN